MSKNKPAMKFEDWREEYKERQREQLRNQSALNRLGQCNYGGVQRSPVRHQPPKDREEE